MPLDQKEALRRVGRNLLNFQRLEHLLKIALPNISFSTSGPDVAAAIAGEARRFKNQTLGHLTHNLDKRLFDPRADETQSDTDPPYFSFSLKLDLPDEHRLEYKKRWLELLKSRNALIHHQLVDVDFESTEECTRLCTELDEQNRKICAQFQEVVSLFDTMEEMQRYVLANLGEQMDAQGETGST